MDGASPITVTAVRVGAAVGDGVGVGAVAEAGVPLLPPHAHRPTASKPALANEAIHRRMRTRLPGAARTDFGVKMSELILRNQRAGDDPKAHRQQFSHRLSSDSDIKRASCATAARICCADAVGTRDNYEIRPTHLQPRPPSGLARATRSRAAYRGTRLAGMNKVTHHPRSPRS